MKKFRDMVQEITPTMPKLLGSLVAATVLLYGAAAEACADLALVLAIDGSGSIDTEEYVTQLEGYRDALASHAVRRALAQAGRVEMGAVLWGDDAMSSTVFPLRNVDNPQVLDAFAEELRWAGRRTWGNTGIGAAIWLSLDLLAAPEHCAARRVINVSGDGRSSRSPKSRRGASPHAYVAPTAARARATADGVTVNGLAILNEDPGLTEYYRGTLITGPGAFVMEVQGFDTFRQALIRKLVREIEPAALSALSDDVN